MEPPPGCCRGYQDFSGREQVEAEAEGIAASPLAEGGAGPVSAVPAGMLQDRVAQRVWVAQRFQRCDQFRFGGEGFSPRGSCCLQALSLGTEGRSVAQIFAPRSN